MDVGVTAEFDVDADDIGGRRVPPFLFLPLSLSLFTTILSRRGGVAEEGRELSASPLGKSDRGLSAESIYLFISA